jgi:hypothetical protein
VRGKAAVNPFCVKSSEIIGDNLSKAVGAGAAFAAVDSNGQPMFAADAHRDDGKRFIVHADEKLSAFVELELAIRAASDSAAELRQKAREWLAKSAVNRIREDPDSE